MVSFQMKHSNRPQTIAVVKSEVDIKSFRDNPEWYEITTEDEKPKTVKVTPVKTKRKEEDATQKR